MALSGKLLRGTRFSLGFKSTAHNLATTSFTVVARGPDGTTEIVWKWRPLQPGLGDDVFFWEPANSRLVFRLSSSWTKAGFAVGSWKLYLLVGNPPTDQDNMTEYSLAVKDPKGNTPLPTED